MSSLFPLSIPQISIRVLRVVLKNTAPDNSNPEMVEVEELITPNHENGFVGTFPVGTKLVIEFEVPLALAHFCFSLNRDLVRQPKATFDKNAQTVIYRKNITVMPYEETMFEDGIPSGVLRSAQVPSWPFNEMGIEIGMDTYHAGIICRYGSLFLAIEKDEPALELNSLLLKGTVLHFSPLRGIATIFTGKTGLNAHAKLFWKNIPYRQPYGLRCLFPGEVITFSEKDIIPTRGSTSFCWEIRACTIK